MDRRGRSSVAEPSQPEQLPVCIELQFEEAMDALMADKALQGAGRKPHPSAVLGTGNDLPRSALVEGEIFIGRYGQPKANAMRGCHLAMVSTRITVG